MTRVDDYFLTADSSQQMLVSDTGQDQTLITSTLTVLHHTGWEVVMSGAIAGQSPGESFPVVSAVAKLVYEDRSSYIAYVHQALLDSNSAQVELLFSVHQSLRLPGNGIYARCKNDVNGKPGLQCAKFGDHTLPFYFDGTRYFFEVHVISEEELLH
jgi:hypothetical protein